MTDIIVISPTAFDVVKKSISIDTSIKTKYDQIFEKYECFFKTNIGPKNVDVKHNKYNHQARKDSYHTVEAAASKPRPKKQRTLNQEILGLLNILNKSNYPKVLSKFRLLSTKENISFLIEEILNKCCLQIVYVNFYTQLLVDLIDMSGYSSQIIKAVEVFYKSLLESDYVMFCCESSKEDYDAFCLEQKHKQLVKARNNLILTLHKKNILMIDINEYISFVLVHLQKSLTDSFHLDLILSVIVDIVSSSKDKINFYNNFKLISHLKTVLDSPPNKKITFTCENILKEFI